MSRLYEEKLSRVEGAPAYPSRLSKCPLFFFMVGFTILKDFLCLFGAKFTGRKFYRWRHDNWPIGQWVIFHTAPDTAYVNHEKSTLTAWLTRISRQIATNFECDCIKKITTPWKSCARANLLHLLSIVGDCVKVGQRFLTIYKAAILRYSVMHDI